MTFYLGIDVGGTKTHALIADAAGRVAGFARGGTGNHEVIGLDGTRAVLQEVIVEALRSAGIGAEQLAGTGIGMAGYDWPFQRQPMLDMINSLGLGAPYELVNDTIIALLAGATQGWGVAVVAGTSCNCRGWTPERSEGRVAGFGALLGENGGGGELVLKAVHAVAAHWARRGPETRLSEAFVQHTGAHDLTDLIEGITVGRIQLGSSAAPLVFEAALAGDATARELAEWSGRELGSLALGVIRQLGFEDQDFEVVMSGRFFDGSPLVAEAMGITIHAGAPGARLVRLDVPPVVGGVLLGMEQTGSPPGACREALAASVKASGIGYAS